MAERPNGQDIQRTASVSSCQRSLPTLKLLRKARETWPTKNPSGESSLESHKTEERKSRCMHQRPPGFAIGAFVRSHSCGLHDQHPLHTQRQRCYSLLVSAKPSLVGASSLAALSYATYPRPRRAALLSRCSCGRRTCGFKVSGFRLRDQLWFRAWTTGARIRADRTSHRTHACTHPDTQTPTHEHIHASTCGNTRMDCGHIQRVRRGRLAACVVEGHAGAAAAGAVRWDRLAALIARARHLSTRIHRSFNHHLVGRLSASYLRTIHLPHHPLCAPPPPAPPHCRRHTQSSTLGSEGVLSRTRRLFPISLSSTSFLM